MCFARVLRNVSAMPSFHSSTSVAYEVTGAMSSDLDKFRFQMPASIKMIGSFKSGKSTYIRKLLRFRREMFDKEFYVVYYVFVFPQSWFSETSGVISIKEIPQDLDPERNSLIIFDDFLANRTKLKDFCEYFIGAAHHYYASVIFITQIMFLQDAYFRTISLNSSALIIFRSVRIADQLQVLSRQLFGGSRGQVPPRIYSDACRTPFSYILIDLSQTCPDNFRVRAKILPDEGPEVVYDTSVS